MKTIKPIIIALLLTTMGASACSTEKADNIAEAQAAINDNKFQEARIFLLNQLRENPADANANALYANVMLQLGDGDSALTALEKLPAEYAELRALKSQALILKGRGDDVLAQYETIDQANLSAQDWRMIIWAKFSTNALDAAYKDAQIALKKYPENSDILSFAGNYHLEKGNNPLALQFAERALQYDDANYEALNLAARANLRLNKAQDAKIYYERAALAYPDNPIPVINLAGIAMDVGDLDTARTNLETAERLNAALPLTKFIKARYLNLSGDNAAAKVILQDANSGLDGFGPAVFLAGKVAFELGEFSVARSRLNRSLAIDPDNQEARILLTKIP